MANEQRPTNLQRLAVLRKPGVSEECVLAIAQGHVPTVVDDPRVGPDDFVAMVHFAKLGPGSWQLRGGQRCWVMPIVDGPTVNRSFWTPYTTAFEAIQRIESEKARLLADGWGEGEFDPIGDPD
jgi:hypothetical protein